MKIRPILYKTATGNRLPLIALMILSLCPAILHASQPNKVYGWLEYAYLMPWDVKVKAKLDTGAKTSSIHAVNIQPFERDGEPWVRFTLGDPIGKQEGYEDGIEVEAPVVREVRIKEHVGESRRRYVVNLQFCLDGMNMPLEASLADRSNFNYELLLGRRSMADKIVVDPARKFTVTTQCQKHKSAKQPLDKK